MVIYTDWFFPKWSGGVCIGPLILIRPCYRQDAGLLAHEQVHRRQWLRSWGLHSVRYLFSRRYRLAAEVEAYRTQLPYYPDDHLGVFAGYLSTRYGLNITVEQALGHLTDGAH